MTRLFNNPDKDLNIYSKISLGDAMSQLTGGRRFWTKPTAIADVKRLIKLGMSRGEIKNKGSGQFLYKKYRDEFNKLLPSTKTFWTKPTAIADVKRLIKLGMSRGEITNKVSGRILYCLLYTSPSPRDS